MSTDDPFVLAVMDNIEMFHNNNMVDAETVGFKLKADVFQSIVIIIGFGFDGQHRDASP